MFFRKVLLKGLRQRIEKLLSRSLLKKRLRHRFLSSFEFFKILTFRQNIQVTYSDFLQRIRVAATGNSVFWDIGFRKCSCSIKRKTSHIYRFSMISFFSILSEHMFLDHFLFASSKFLIRCRLVR